MKRGLIFLMVSVLTLVVLSPAWAADKPRIAVLEFKHKADGGYWWNGGAEAMQDVFVTELVKSGKFRVMDRESLSAVLREKNLALSGDIDPATAVRAGKLIGVKYLLTGAVTEYGLEDAGASGPGVGGLPSFSVKKRKFTAAANARLIDAETGEIVWADEARGEESSRKIRVGGFGGGVDDRRMFDKVMKPVVADLTASLKASDL
ncbi:MAG: CsgG/HfaB family protein [Acidobacteriota bacterium]